MTSATAFGPSGPGAGAGLPSRPADCPLCGGSARSVLWQRHGFHWVRCPADGMVWVTPRLAPEAIAAIYAAGHESKARDLGPADRPIPRRYRLVVNDLARRVGAAGRMLEVGAFDGLFLAAAKEAGWDVVGTEIDAAAAAAATARGLPMHLGELAAAGLPAGSFDAVVLRDVIEHLPDPHAELARLAGLQRSGGVLYVWTPNFGSLTSRILRENWGAVVFPWHFHYFSAATLGAMLVGAGYRILSVASRNLLWGRPDPSAILAVAGRGADAATIASVGSSGSSGPVAHSSGAVRDIPAAARSTVARPEAARSTVARRTDRWLARAANPVFAGLDGLGVHLGAQLEMVAERV